MTMLQAIEKALHENGLPTQRVAPGGGGPMEQLGVRLAADGRGRRRTLWITPLPDPDERLAEGVSLAQFFVELPFKPAAAGRADLGELILWLNNILPLGGFGLRQPEEAILYRCVLVLGPNPADNGLVGLETVLLVSFLVDQFSDLLESVAAGHKTCAAAVADLGVPPRTAALN
jgi:hypothetical protein